VNAGAAPAEARVVETHVSILVFLDDIVLKYKKALRLPFVDFTTPSARLAACRAEVDANSRLSPDVYLGVADVVMGDRVLDHAVVMRRLPPERNLAHLASAHAAELDDDLHRLAAVLAAFHAGADRSPAIAAQGEPDVLARTWRGCMDTLRACAPADVATSLLARLDELAMRYLEGRGPLLAGRIQAGRVCDGHGDLLATDVFLLDDGPRVLDCVEFDPRLRFVDVIADVAFLAMDLESLGAPAAAAAFLHHYQQAAGDLFPPSLVHYYCAQRAVVRAEVAAIRAAQSGSVVARSGTGAARPGPGRPQQAPQGTAALLDLALGHLEEGRVVMGVVSGLPGTGKSTVAGALGAHLRWPVLGTDEIRRELVDPGAPRAPSAPFGAGAYAPEVTERTYRTLLDRARVALGLGQPVLLDATFTDPRWRRAAEEVARDAASDLVVLECRARTAVTTPRLRARQAHGADASAADESVARAMAVTARPWAGAVGIDTGEASPAGAVEQALAILRPSPCGPAGRPGAP
jgi:aminoglycoside phosphotransferase family enzyme/predicted kinase